MNEAAMTLDGWYVLHDLRNIDWTAWKNASSEQRKNAIGELVEFWKELSLVEEKNEGSHGMFSMLGHKADLLFMHLRSTLQELNALEIAFQKTSFANFTKANHSYVSVVELSNYVNGEHKMNSEADAYVQRRLKPILPQLDHVCFYPMNKRRESQNNWYMLAMEERRNMMKSHGAIGRTYSGRVTQIISGSIGFDDWEWGVTLFANDPLTFKKLIYEMRFDEVSARYSDFGSFFVGNRLTLDTMEEMMAV